MATLMPIEALGQRICIMGSSNSGKSTLAAAISRKTGLPAIHLDQLHHLPHTNWVPRERQEFLQLHAHAISQERWVMDGNYTKCIAERLKRATGLILLDVSTGMSLLRYIRRCYVKENRFGALEGGQDSVKWGMIKHIVWVTPANRQRYRTMFEQIQLPKLLLLTPNEVDACYEQWGL